MASINIFNIDGSTSRSAEIPDIFHERIRPDLIMRAVIAENSLNLQPQAHYVLAGMQTSARYYGAMNSWRTGRHMGIAIRPREKLGGGVQGKVKRIPSSVKGKRAHPHLIEKKIEENINRKEYQKAIMSAIAATAHYHQAKDGITSPIVVSNDIESIKRTKDIVNMLEKLKLGSALAHGKLSKLRKGVRRSGRQRLYKKSILVVVGDDKGVIKAARNIPGLDACTVMQLRANLLAPGGRPGRLTIWSEDAIKKLSDDIRNINLM